MANDTCETTQDREYKPHPAPRDKLEHLLHEMSFVATIRPKALETADPRNMRRTVLELWMLEEIREYIEAETRPDELDALFDLLGIIVLMLSMYEHGEAGTLSQAEDAYTRSQLERGRPVARWHDIIHHITSMTIAEKAQPRHILTAIAAKAEQMAARIEELV